MRGESCEKAHSCRIRRLRALRAGFSQSVALFVQSDAFYGFEQLLLRGAVGRSGGVIKRIEAFGVFHDAL